MKKRANSKFHPRFAFVGSHSYVTEVVHNAFICGDWVGMRPQGTTKAQRRSSYCERGALLCVKVGAVAGV